MDRSKLVYSLVLREPTTLKRPSINTAVLHTSSTFLLFSFSLEFLYLSQPLEPHFSRARAVTVRLYC
jgi:hypothetical protein